MWERRRDGDRVLQWEVGGSNSFSVGGELFSSVRAHRNKRYSLSWPKNDSLVFVFLLSMLIRCGMQVMNMVVRPCQGCQSHLFTFKAYLMPSNQTTNQLTSDKRKCFLSLSCFASLSLILLVLPFLLLLPQCDECAYRERDAQSVQKWKSFARCLHIVVCCYLLLSGGWPKSSQAVVVVVVVVFAAGSQAERIHALQSGTPYITLQRSSRELRSITCPPLSSTLHAIIPC